VSGFDLTFRAPKSVSILFGIGDNRVVEAAPEAHLRLRQRVCWPLLDSGATIGRTQVFGSRA
jgi:hypothetical protein